MVYLISFPKILAPSDFYQHNSWYMIGATIITFVLIYFIWKCGIDFLQSIFSVILKLVCMPWLKPKMAVSVDTAGNITKRETSDATLADSIETISYFVSGIIAIAASILIVLFGFFTIVSWNSKTEDVVANMNSAIVQSKSNSDLKVKPYKKVVAIKKSKKLQEYLAKMQTNREHNADVVGIESVPVLVKYVDNSQEWFKDAHVALRIRYVKENKPMTVAVYQTKITKKAMKYIQTDDTIHAYNNRQVVITKYIKKKPINWQAVK